VVYALALVASHAVQLAVPGPHFDGTPPGADRARVEVPRFSRRGEIPGPPVRVSYLDWRPAHPKAGAAPVIALHGSPGFATNMTLIGPMLADAGRRVIAPDLPGFGASTRLIPDYSIRAHARSTLALMDALGIERAHVLGYSMGGGVAVWMARLAPERVASLTLASSIGAQEVEGSGNYWFEHAKYLVGWAALVAAPEFVPHFGLLGPRWLRHSFIRNFMDTDQRPIAAQMRSITTPTLIVQGRDDPLVPARAAELHHELIPTSALVMLDIGHGWPFTPRQASQVAAHTIPFLDRHDDPAAAPLIFTADFDPASASRARRIDLGPIEVLRSTPWWVLFLLIVVATWISEDATVIAVGVLIAHGQIDWGVGLLGCFVGIVLGDGGLWAVGRFAGRRALRWRVIRRWVTEDALESWGRWFDRHTIRAVFIARAVPGLRLPTYLAAGLLSRRAHGFLFWAALAAFIWTPFLLVLSITLGPRILATVERYLGGPLGIIVSVAVLLVGWRVITESFTWLGRRRLARMLGRVRRFEFWPRWAIYGPLAPWLLVRGMRSGGVMAFTCANPDIPHGGGVVGESKAEIIEGLLPHAGPWVAATRLIDAGPDADARAAEADRLVREDEALGGYPVVLKPDESQMGHGFKVIRDAAGARAYFEDMTRPALLQAFHPGPKEAGVLWVRDVSGGTLGERGRIFSVTRKEFPAITGDGRRTLERLIWTHPRYRFQAEVFLTRFADRRDEVLPEGHTLRLGEAGNHAQGAMFLDGADLITPALEARFDEIARGFTRRRRAPGEIGGLDFGRFDIRYESDEALKRGEGFCIVELNGTMSESTNMYDPRRSALWSYGVLFRQWAALYAVGAARKRAGVRPVSLMDLLRSARDHFRGRSGPAVSD